MLFCFKNTLKGFFKLSKLFYGVRRSEFNDIFPQDNFKPLTTKELNGAEVQLDLDFNRNVPGLQLQDQLFPALYPSTPERSEKIKSALKNFCGIDTQADSTTNLYHSLIHFVCQTVPNYIFAMLYNSLKTFLPPLIKGNPLSFNPEKTNVRIERALDGKIHVYLGQSFRIGDWEGANGIPSPIDLLNVHCSFTFTLTPNGDDWTIECPILEDDAFTLG